jgi:hypothetical protein
MARKNQTRAEELKEALREAFAAEDVRRVLRETIKESLVEDARKDVVKAALAEWLEDKFAQFGKWSLYGIIAMAVAAIAYLSLAQHGWTPPRIK